MSRVTVRKPQMEKLIMKQTPFKKTSKLEQLFTGQRIYEFNDEKETLILPLNETVLFLGPRGAGKSFTMGAYIRSFLFDDNMKYLDPKDLVYGRFFYIHGENVDSTMVGYVPPSRLINVPTHDAQRLIGIYISIKHKFLSCIRYMRSIIDKEPEPYTDHIIAMIERDNRIDEKDHRMKFEVCKEFTAKYQQSFEIADSGIVIKDGFKYINYDLFIMDDMSLHQDLVGTSVKNSILYQWATVSRHYMGCWWLAAQNTSQLGMNFKALREDISCIQVFRGTGLSNLKRIPQMFEDKALLKSFLIEFSKLRARESVIINFKISEVEAVHVNSIPELKVEDVTLIQAEGDSDSEESDEDDAAEIDEDVDMH